MRTSVGFLLDGITNNPKAWVVVRDQQNYDAFVNLLLDLGYPSIHPSQVYGWRHRSHAAWTIQDDLVPGNCTGGAENGQIVSTIDALPICEKLLYVVVLQLPVG